MALDITIDDLNIPAALKADTDIAAELETLITSVKRIVLLSLSLDEDDLTEQQELDLPTVIQLEVEARYWAKQTNIDALRGLYGPKDAYVSFEASQLAQVYYSPWKVLE